MQYYRRKKLNIVNGSLAGLKALILVVLSVGIIGNWPLTGWAQPTPPAIITVRPDMEWVDCSNWVIPPPDPATITLTIDNPDNGPGVDYTAVKTTIESDFRFEVEGFDIQPGHIVVVTGGSITIEHTVTSLEVTSVDIGTGIVTGRTDPGAGKVIDIEVDNPYCPRMVSTVADGNWTANFGILDDYGKCVVTFVPGTGGSVFETDWNGNSSTTSVFWNVPMPYITVRPINDWVDGFSWPADVPITLTINGVDIGTTIADASGQFRVELGGTFDIQPGQLVVATDGVTTKMHTVANLAVTSVDVFSNTVSGTADPDDPEDDGDTIDVEIWPWQENCFDQVTAGTGNNWIADFDGLCDIVPGSGGAAQRRDMDGDWTMVDWWLPLPYIIVRPNRPTNDRVDGRLWTTGPTITLTINGVHRGTTTVDASGQFRFELGAFDIQPGHVVVVTDGETTKDHTVTTVAVTSVNAQSNTVSGTADPGDTINVIIRPWQGCFTQVVANEFREWTAYFGGSCDIVPGTGGEAQERDGDGDWTFVSRWLPDNGVDDAPPHFTCYKAETPKDMVFTGALRIGLTDQFGGHGYDLAKVERLCAPANKTPLNYVEERPVDGADVNGTHLEAYKIEESELSCGACKGGVDNLSIQYNGDIPVEFFVDGKVTIKGPYTLPDPPGNTVVVLSGDDKNGKMGASIKFIDFVTGDEIASFHTSCSRPIGIGTESGSFTVIGGTSVEAGELGVCDEPIPWVIKPPWDTCARCDGGVSRARFAYNGAESVVTVTDKDGAVLYDSSTALASGVFDILPFPGEDKLPKTIFLTGAGDPVEIHTSCSKPFGPGLVVGDFTVLEGSSKKGGDGMCPVIRIENQFGTEFLTIKKPKHLLVPTIKDLFGPVVNRDLPTDSDHYKCYDVKSLGLPDGLEVNLEDQFDTRNFEIDKTKLLCNPVEKAHVGVTPITNAAGHLACYKIKPLEKGFCALVDPDGDSAAVGQICSKDEECGDGLFCAKDVNTRAYLFNQFGDEIVDVKKAYELCVPSTATVGLQ